MSPKSLAPAKKHATTGGGGVTPPVGTPFWKSGVYRGGVYASNPDRLSELRSFKLWRAGGADEYPTAVGDFLSSATWARIEGSDTTQLNALKTLSDNGVRIDLAVPILPKVNATDGTTTLVLGADPAGFYDGHFAALATALATRNILTPVIRLGWEMNSSQGFPWSLGITGPNVNVPQNTRGGAAGVADFIALWIRVVSVMRPILPSAMFFFCPISGWGGVGPNPGTMCPPDQYVDMMGVDLYDQSWSVYPLNVDPAQWAVQRANAWASYRSGEGRSFGLDYWRDRAGIAGKPFAIGEWGVNKRSDSPEHGGLDNPDFVLNMHAYLLELANAGRLSHDIYFDYSAPDGDHRLYSYGGQAASIFPLAAAQYRALTWGI